MNPGPIPERAADPLTLFADFLNEATAMEIENPNAFVLSTADTSGRVSSRVVLLKDFDENGFVFYTNLDSRKARDLERNAHAALNFYWRETGKQVLIEGEAHQVTDAEADAYFATRPRESQIGAWASAQSRPLARRAILTGAFEAADARYRGEPVPRPPCWSGFRIVPDRLEFWILMPHRLHDRTAFTRSGSGWKMGKLYP